MKYISFRESNISEEERKQHNKKYIEEKLITEKEYFDKMYKNIDETIKLDDNQRKIILTDEDYVMVIAGAGSGKTTTITAKVNYLIEKQNIKEQEIVVITFTNKAVEELKERINKEFQHNIKITTFHKLGYEIIKNNTNIPPKINNNKSEILKDIITNKIKQNPRIGEKLLKYFKKQPCVVTKSKKFTDRKQNIMSQNDINQITEEYATIISLLKANNKSIGELNKLETKNKLEKEIIEFSKAVYIEYNKKLESQNQIDYDDMINKATEIINKTKQLSQKYKTIIIDEYQDISECRYKLIKTLSEKMNSKIMVVGDDWQCIYSFAASNINLFTQFKKNVPYCEILKIEHTYRNSQELINIAGKFIQKNSNQIKKTLVSNKQLEKPIKIINYKKDKIKHQIRQIIDYIIDKYGENKSILILGRYTNDIQKVIDNNEIKEENKKIIYKKHPEVKINYLTVHSSKGLGYDNVILINAKDAKMGFPSKKQSNQIIEQLTIKEKNIKYPEERRLFYVALTRTKNEMIILSPKRKQSEFIKELKKYKNVEILSNIKSINK